MASFFLFHTQSYCVFEIPSKYAIYHLRVYKALIKYQQPCLEKASPIEACTLLHCSQGLTFSPRLPRQMAAGNHSKFSQHMMDGAENVSRFSGLVGGSDVRRCPFHSRTVKYVKANPCLLKVVHGFRQNVSVIYDIRNPEMRSAHGRISGINSLSVFVSVSGSPKLVCFRELSISTYNAHLHATLAQP